MSRWLLTGLVAALLAVAAPAAAEAMPAPPGMGNYCSTTGPGTAWGFASLPGGGDPCSLLGAGTIRRKGLYASSNSNRVVYRCYPPNYGWVGIYEGWGNGPLTAAFNAAQGKPGCIFNVSPTAMAIFDAPFALSTSYTHASGHDFAKAPYNTLNVQDFGQVGSASATIVDWKGRDKSQGGYINGHSGHDWTMPKGTQIRSAADGVVVMARDYETDCLGSDSTFQKEVAVRHTVVGASGYRERFLTYYAHLKSYGVKVGDAVAKGTILGYSGNTGCSSGPHLHFGVIRLTNTADQLEETVHWFDTAQHSDATDKDIEAYGWAAPMGFDPWAYKAYPQGALSLNLWRTGQAPSVGSW